MDIDREKAQAALEQLEAEKARRLQAKIDSGEVVAVQTVVVAYRDEDVEEAKARAVARQPIPDDGRHVREFSYVISGLPRGPDYWELESSSAEASACSAAALASSKGPLSTPSEEAARGGEVLSPSPPSEPTYVRVIIRNGDEDDPGQIAEAWYTIEDGLLVLRDRDDKHITSRALLKGEDPAPLARILLREAEAPKDFQRPLSYPKMGLA
jgi:hypothetical protein